VPKNPVYKDVTTLVWYKFAKVSDELSVCKFRDEPSARAFRILRVGIVGSSETLANFYKTHSS